MKKILLTLQALIFVLTISKAQTIPNPGFESWTAMSGYDNPDTWSCLNSLTSAKSTYTCMKGSPGNPGSSYLKLVSKTVTGMGVVPGISTSGTLDQTTFQPISGFAFNTRPEKLTGNWQHMIYGSSQGYVDIKLTRWDAGMKKRIPVASGHVTLSGMAMSWAAFTVPLTYSDGGNPDSCMITFSASGSTPTNNDYLYIDNVAFSGTVAGVSQIGLDESISFFPNPASQNLVVDLSSLKDNDVSIRIYDLQSKEVMSIQSLSVSSRTTIDISELPKGYFILNITAKEGIFTRKFINQ